MDGLGLVFPALSTTGGVERVVLEVARHFAALVPTAFYGTTVEGSLPGGVEHVPVQPRRAPRALRTLAFREAASRSLRERAASRVISFGVQCPPGDVLWVGSVHRAWLEAARTVQVRGVSVDARVRFLMPHHRALLSLERAYFRSDRPQHVFCTSQREVDDLRRLYDVPAERLHVVPNGYDPSTFSPATTAQRRDAERRRLGIEPDAVVLLFLANELHRKGYSQALEALALAGDDRLRLHLVGRTPPVDFASRTRTLGLEHRVRYLGASDDVPGHLAAADVLLLPSQYEPFGLVVVEALAAGVPVVVSAVTGAAQAVQDDVHGRVLQDALDVEELAAHLVACLDDERRAAWAAAAPAAAAPYSWSRVLTSVEGAVLHGA